MGTGYTRNDTANNIADGNVINAADFDGEYDAIEAAFNSSTGHTHDGTAAEGAPITVLGPSQEFVATSSEVKPSTNAGLDLGTSGLKFKDLYIDGTAYIDGLGGNLLIDTSNALQFRDAQLSISSSADGQLDIAADTTAKITSPEVIVTDDFRLQSDAAILTFGADDDVTVTHVADTGLDAKAASGFNLKLQTGDTTVEDTNTIGKISFNAPDEASGTDAILVGAEIEAAAEATFSSTVNSTALVFKTNDSAAATERMRIKSDGDILFKGASYDLTWDTSAHALTTSTSNGDLNITPHGTGSVVVTGDLDVDNINIDGNTISSTDTDGNINLTPNGTGQVVVGGGFVPSEIALTSTDGGAAKGPQLDIFRDSASPADGDAIGYIDFSGDDSGNNKTVYASILATAVDVTDTTEDGKLEFNTMVAGTDTTILTVDADGLDVTGAINIDSTSFDPASGWGASQDVSPAGLNFEDNGTTVGSLLGQTYKTDSVTWGTTRLSGFFGMEKTNGSGNGDFVWWLAPTNFAQNPAQKMRIANNGDISFYEDTGTTAKFFWDASAESLGIGTSSPTTTKLQINYTAASENGLRLYGTNTAQNNALLMYDGSSNYITQGINAGAYTLATNGTERMRIDSSGNVGIGRAPDTRLEIASGNADGDAGLDAPVLRITNTTASSDWDSGDVNGTIEFYTRDTSGNAPYDTAFISSVGDDNNGTLPSGALVFGTATYNAVGGAVERMRIDSSGNVGIGTSSPSERLHVSTVGSSGVQTAARFSSSTDASGCKIERDGSAWRLASQGALHLGADYDANGTAASSLIIFEIDATETMRIDSSGNVGIGTSSPNTAIHVQTGSNNEIAIFQGADAQLRINNSTANEIQLASTGAGDDMTFATNSTERMRIDSSGNVLVGTTSTGFSAEGHVFRAGDYASHTVDNDVVMLLNRTTSDGGIMQFRKDGTSVGSIGAKGGDIYVGNSDVTLSFNDTADLIAPTGTDAATRDGVIDLGNGGNRFDDIFATNGTIQTSDEREKQQIGSLTDAEITAAKAISKLFKTFKWNDSVAAKGDAARTHTGVIAQQVETAMSDAGLDAGNYAFFISSTWWETETEVAAVEAVDAVYETVTIPAVEEEVDEEGNVIVEAQPETTEQRLVSEAVEAKEAYTRTDTYNTLEEAPEGATERNRKGIRYPELLSFIGAATEQRLTSIEARLEALEAN